MDVKDFIDLNLSTTGSSGPPSHLRLEIVHIFTLHKQ